MPGTPPPASGGSWNPAPLAPGASGSAIGVSIRRTDDGGGPGGNGGGNRPPPGAPPAPPAPPPPRPSRRPGPLVLAQREGVLHGAQVARGRAVEVAWAADERRLLDARGWTVLLGVAVPTVGAVDAETELVHVAVLDVLQGVLEGTVGLPALVILGEESARGHARLVELMQEAAVVALHAQATEPVAAHRLGGEGGTGGSIHGLGWRCGDGGTARGGRASDLAP